MNELLSFKPFINNCFFLYDYYPLNSFRSYEEYYTANKILLTIKSARKLDNRFNSAVKKIIPAFVNLLNGSLKYLNNTETSIIPIPSSTSYRKDFYPVLALVSILAKNSKITFLNALERWRSIKSSHNTNKRSEEQHISSIRIFNNDILNKRTLILFDDIYTTGATYRACEKIIRSMGFKKNILGCFIGRARLLD